MNDFKECYQSAVEDMNMLGMKEFHIDASSCMDKRRHNRWIVRRLRRTAATAFSAVCVVFLCGFGTVKAAEYIENVIKVKEWGFESADAATMARNEADNTCAHIISEEIGMPLGEEGSSGAFADGDINVQIEMEEDEESSRDQYRKMMEPEEMGTADYNVSSEPDALEAKEAGEEERTRETEGTDETERAGRVEEMSGEEEILSESLPVKNYSSLEEFEKSEDIIFPQPSINIEKISEAASVTVCGDWAMVRYDMDGKIIWVERTDYANTQGHASSKVFPGGVCNERQYTTAQGYTYTLVDSVKEDEEEPLQIHGAVTVGTYEAYIDFIGYTETEAEEIIESIDLSLYE